MGVFGPEASRLGACSSIGAGGAFGMSGGATGGLPAGSAKASWTRPRVCSSTPAGFGVGGGPSGVVPSPFEVAGGGSSVLSAPLVEPAGGSSVFVFVPFWSAGGGSSRFGIRASFARPAGSVVGLGLRELFRWAVAVASPLDFELSCLAGGGSSVRASASRVQKVGDCQQNTCSGQCFLDIMVNPRKRVDRVGSLVIAIWALSDTPLVQLF